MIAVNEHHNSNSTTSASHAEFLAMLPAIRRTAQISFRKVRPELRDELIEEVIANAFCGFARLVERDQVDRALPSPLARFAIAQVRVGRRVGNRLCVRDVMSNYAQFRKNFRLERLDKFDEQAEEWKEVLIEDGRSGPAETAAARLDFAAWLCRLTARLRKIALSLAGGATTKDAAKQFGLSPARISQLREWLKKSWEAFQGEAEVGGAQSAAA
jgi:hypothetical protein